MTGDQDFIIEVMKLLMPFLSLLATGFIAWMQFKGRAERKEILTEQKKLAIAVDGMQDKLIASTAADSFQQGATSERMNPEVPGSR